VLSNRKIPMHIRRRLYQAIAANIALWGSESWALKEDRFKLESQGAAPVDSSAQQFIL
jgi:hypothetical protein